MRRVSVILALLTALMAARVYAVEPQALVGEWGGEWKASTVGNTLSMTITKIDGERVQGSVFIRGNAPYHNKDIPFVGKLAGNTFSTETATQPGSPPMQWQLTVDPTGTKMEGTAQATARASISLSKRK